MTRIVQAVTHPITARYLMRGQPAWLRRRGFEVTVVAAPGPDLVEVAERERVAVEPVPMKREPAPLADTLALVRLVRLFRRLRPTIVNAGTPKAGFLGMVAARMARVPVRVYTQRGLRLDGTRGVKRRVLAATERAAVGCAHRVLCNSESLRWRMVELGLAPEAKTIVLGAGSSNGVDVERFRPRSEGGPQLRGSLGIPPDAPVVGFVGRLVRDKGIADLAAAMEEVWRRAPQARLLLVGELEAGDAVGPDLVARLAAAPRVVATGWAADVAPYYGVMDVLAFPSYREGLPNAPLEAAACELPVAGYAATGTVDAVAQGETGTLAPVGDVAGLAAALTTYVEDPDLRRAHGAAGRRRAVELFRPEVVWEALAAEYDRLLVERGLAPAAAPRAPEPASREGGSAA
jgi:glycosyltransferase involved in cell wall biosynthesis